jgi:hypothetical protein
MHHSMKIHTYTLTLCGPYHRRMSTRTLLVRIAQGLLAVLLLAVFLALTGCQTVAYPGGYNPYQAQPYRQTAASYRGTAVRLPQQAPAPAVHLPQQIGGSSMFLVNPNY